MTTNWKIVAIAAVAISKLVPVGATAIEGTFSGGLYAAQGTQDGVDLSALAGMPITGTFTFDSQSLRLTSGGSGTDSSSFVAMNPASPLAISLTIGSNTFTVDGTFYSTVTTSAGAVSTFFSLDAQAGSDSIGFGLTEYGSIPFLSNTNDSGSTNFSFSAPAESEQGIGQADFNDANSSPGILSVLEYYITDATAGPAASSGGGLIVMAPEIDQASACTSITFILGVMAVIRGRRPLR